MGGASGAGTGVKTVSSSSTFARNSTTSSSGLESLPSGSFRTQPSDSSTAVVHGTARYSHGTLIQQETENVNINNNNNNNKVVPTSTTTSTSTKLGEQLLEASINSEDETFGELLHKVELVGVPDEELNFTDRSGRTPLSYICSNGNLSMLEAFAQLPGVDINRPDTEGNTPLHYAAQAGHTETLNFLLSRCQGVEVDTRNSAGFTPLMKAALQGRTKCAKILLFAGASGSLRDYGRGLRAEEWAKYCGRHVCAEVIEKFSRKKPLGIRDVNGKWPSEPDFGDLPILSHPEKNQTSWLRSKLKRAFRSGDKREFSLASQLTSAALCASSAVLPTPVKVMNSRTERVSFVVPKVEVTPAMLSDHSVSETAGNSSDRTTNAKNYSVKIKK